MSLANGALLLAGVVLIVAGVLGGGVTGFGWGLPALAGWKRLACVAMGALAIGASFMLGVDASGQVTLRLPMTTAAASGVPNVYGMRLEDARAKLVDAHYVVAATEQVCSNSIRVAGLVRQVLTAADRRIVVEEPPTGVTDFGRGLAPGSTLLIKVATGSAC